MATAVVWHAPLWVLGAQAGATVVWFLAVLKLGRLRELHHFWYGLLAMWLFPREPWVVYGGLGVMWDDALQHALQALFGLPWETRGGPASPVHLFARYAIYTPYYWAKEQWQRRASGTP